MNAAVVRAFDAPPRFDSFADPVPTGDEVLVHVSAAALHPIVKALANGSHYGSTGELPFVAGVDGTGRLQDGSRVYFGSARPPYGTMAELGLASPRMLIHLPDGLDETLAAAMANPGMSSWVALEARAKFAAGESVLILGATGVAGQLAIQIAKRMGARNVIAAGRSPNEEELKALGADTVLDLSQAPEEIVTVLRQLWAETGIDVVLDYVWGAPAERVFEAIAQRGLSHAAPRVRYIQIGNSAGATIPLSAATLRSSGLELLGSGFGSASLEQIQGAISRFFAMAAKQPFQMSLKTAPLSEVESLWNQPEKGTRLVFQI